MSGYTFLTTDPFGFFFGMNFGDLPDGPDPDSLPDLWVVAPEYTDTEWGQGAILYIASEDLLAADLADGGPADGRIVFDDLFVTGPPALLPNSYLITGTVSGSGYPLAGDGLGDIDGDGSIELVFTDSEIEHDLPGPGNSSSGTSFVFSPADLAASDDDGDGIVSLADLAGNTVRFANLADDGFSLLSQPAEIADTDGDGDLEHLFTANQSGGVGGGNSGEVLVVSTSDLPALTHGAYHDLGLIDATHSPDSWVFYTPFQPNNGIDAAFVQIDGGGPSELVVTASLIDEGVPDAGAVYLIHLSFPGSRRS